ncbi:MAG TPA: SAM-dependent methyltransferase [Solibacterales bacterium]|nr:SAM-dependent methyltransferase [Bryobacterales bacterium]
MTDRSNGYEAIAAQFIAGRESDPERIGADVVRRWAMTLAPGAAVLDLGCGCGIPITQALIESGCDVCGWDASPSMVAAFRERFPTVPVECAGALEPAFAGRAFDGVVSWGLLFLLTAEEQAALIRRLPELLGAGGQVLFTAPWQIGRWADNMTGRESVSLGRAEYARLLTEAGLDLVDEQEDAGGNHYYRAAKRSEPRIAYANPERAETAIRNVLEAQGRTWGGPLLNHLIYARRPSLFRGARAMWSAIEASGLIDGKLAALVNRRVAAHNGCVF